MNKEKYNNSPKETRKISFGNFEGELTPKEKTGYPSIDRNHEDGVSILKRKPFIPPCSVYDACKLLNIGNTKAFVECSGVQTSISDLLKHTDLIARSLSELGVKKGEIATLCIPNITHGIPVFLASNKLGVGVSFLDAKESPVNIIKYLNLFESRVFFAYDKTQEVLKEIISKTKVKVAVNISSINSVNILKSSSQDLGYENVISYADFINLAEYYKNSPKSVHAPSQEALYLFTSGSTGSPKIPVLTNGNILSSSMYMKHSAKSSLSNKQSVLVPVSFNYPYGFAVSTLMSLLSRKSIILAPDLKLDNLSKYFALKPNIIFGTPPIAKTMVTDPEIDKMDLGFIDMFISGGDNLPTNDNIEATEFLAKHNSKSKVCNGSGNAETVAAGTTAINHPYNPATVGYTLLGTVAEARDIDTLEPKKYEEEGLLAYSGGYVFKEYYNDPEATADAKKVDKDGNEWFISDTIGVVHSDGSISMNGRAKRYFITFDKDGGAYKGYCDYIQNCILTFPEVSECAVVKKPNPVKGEVAKAYIVLKNGYEPSQELKDIIWARCLRPIKTLTHSGEIDTMLKTYEVPEEFTFIETLPRTAAEKIAYIHLEEQTAKEYQDNVKKLTKS